MPSEVVRGAVAKTELSRAIGCRRSFLGLVVLGVATNEARLWFAYVATRPLGASFADWMGKPSSSSGLGWGDGTVALVLTIAIFCLVAYLAVTRRDVQRVHPGPADTPARVSVGVASYEES